jgi:hypothetical protein
MSFSSDIFVHAADFDESVFAGVSRSALIENLLGWFDAWLEDGQWIDPESICDAGILVGKSGFERLDAEAWDWHSQEPTSKRHELVADFLWGYWRTAKRPSADTVNDVIAGLNDLPREHWAFAASLFALYAIYAWGSERVPRELAERVEEVLVHELHELETAGLHPGLAATLRNVKVRVQA